MLKPRCLGAFLYGYEPQQKLSTEGRIPGKSGFALVVEEAFLSSIDAHAENTQLRPQLLFAPAGNVEPFFKIGYRRILIFLLEGLDQ